MKKGNLLKGRLPFFGKLQVMTGSDHTLVVLVDREDRELGTMEKMEAHRQAKLHRAFSVFIFDGEGRMLLQQRAHTKYHSGGLWTNACCSHPFPGEAVAAAAARRLQEELGFSVPLTPAFSFVYKADFDNGLTEYEYDHVFTGYYEAELQPDPAEIAATAYQPMDVIREELRTHPGKYTVWFRLAFPQLEAWLRTRAAD